MMRIKLRDSRRGLQTPSIESVIIDITQSAAGLYENDPVGWMERYFYIPELKGAIQLAPYQKAVLREAYRKDESGRFVYSTVVWSDLKKSSKSTIAAAVILHRALHTFGGSYKIIANDLKQADSRVAYYLRRAITLNKRDLLPRARLKNYQVKLDNNSVIEAIPIDPEGEAGGNDDMICYSELWGAFGDAASRMWTELTLSPTKFGKSQRWVETYAGFTGESTLLEQLYQSGVNLGKRIDLSYDGHDLSDLEVYANESAQMLCLWNTVPRLPWQTPAYYASEAAILQPEEFARVHRNQWASAVTAFIPVSWWDACESSSAPKIKPYQGVVIGVDAATTNDTFSVVAVYRSDEKVVLLDCAVWEPGEGA
jgi:phage terminase large subunit-like protein